MINRYFSRKTLPLLFLLLATTSVFAQKKNGIEYSGFFDTYYYRGPLNIIGGVGTTFFRGDICKFTDCNTTPLFFSLGASYQVWPRTYFGVEVNYVQLGGSSDTLPSASFSVTGVQFDAFARFLILDKTVTRHSQLRKHPFLIRPYISTGIGSFYTMNTSLTRDSLSEGDSDGFSRIAFTVPVGLGFQIWLSHRISIMPELTYRFAFTDYLDGVSYSDNDFNMDGYAALALKVQYTPTAKRVRKKKTKLSPPEQYDGPKGTDYPRKREEPKPKTSPYSYPDNGGQDDGGQDDGGWDNGGQDDGGWDDGGQDDGGWDNGGEEGGQEGGQDNGGENDGWNDGGQNDGGQENGGQQNTDDEWGW